MIFVAGDESNGLISNASPGNKGPTLRESTTAV